MAKKVDKKAKQASAPSGADASAAAELDVLYPSREVPIGAEVVLVDEINFEDSLRLSMHIAPIVKAIEEAVLATGSAPGYDQIVDVLGGHWKSTLVLLQAVTGKPPEWFKFSAKDGELLLLTFWNVNASFFYQRAINAVAVAQEVKRLLAGENSSPPSGPTDTAQPTAAATPSDS